MRDLLGRDPASMGEDASGSVSGMFNGLTLGPQAIAPNPDTHQPKGVNGTHARELVPEVQIGFFLHTPFPSSEVFRCVAVPRSSFGDGVLNFDASQCPSCSP